MKCSIWKQGGCLVFQTGSFWLILQRTQGLRAFPLILTIMMILTYRDLCPQKAFDSSKRVTLIFNSTVILCHFFCRVKMPVPSAARPGVGAGWPRADRAGPFNRQDHPQTLSRQKIMPTAKGRGDVPANRDGQASKPITPGRMHRRVRSYLRAGGPGGRHKKGF